MPAKKYRVDLTAHERETLRSLIRFGKTAAPQVTPARILLKADEGLSDEAIAEEVVTSRVTVELIRQRFVDESLGALTEWPRTGTPPQLWGKGAAIAKTLEFPYTPEHGSWLNIAELEFSVLSRQCLGRRIPDEATLIRELQAYETHRNATKAKITWRFTSEQARVKLPRLYPPIPQN